MQTCFSKIDDLDILYVKIGTQCKLLVSEIVFVVSILCVMRYWKLQKHICCFEVNSNAIFQLTMTSAKACIVFS